MADKRYIVDGYIFDDKEMFERAKKEKESITQIVSSTNMDDGTELLKIYNKSIEKRAFKTIIGYRFLGGLRKKLVDDEVVSANDLHPIPVAARKVEIVEETEFSEEIKKAKEMQAAENAATEKTKIYRVIITFLVIMIIGIVVITLKSKYTVFTYFTNYEQNIRDEVENEYVQWQEDLEKREKELENKK